MRRALLLAFLLLPDATGCARTLPPLPQVTLAVDTDLPVDRLALQLRLDVYLEDGTWIESREVPRADPRGWPATFTVFAPDDRPRSVLVRLRAYPRGLVRDYRGERFEERPGPTPAAEVIPLPAATDLPRLLVDGVDVTPRSEPIPTATVDHLSRVALGPEGATARVVLRAACAGTMVDLANATTCVDGARVAASAESGPPPSTSLVGTAFGPAPCTETPRPPHAAKDGTPLLDEEVCVGGGTFVLGDPILGNVGLIDGRDVSTNPPRLVHVPALRVDRYEFTVARYREALAAGFAVDDETDLPIPNDKPLPLAPTEDPIEQCTFSTAPLPGDGSREAFALNCLPWHTARALCRFAGGDLLTEAHYEWVASAAGRPRKTPYPWGTAPPRCDLQVYGRERDPVVGGTECIQKPWSKPYTPGPVTEGPGDETPILGHGLSIHGFGGGQPEFSRDVFQPFRSRCWLSQPIHDPTCGAGDTSRHTSRGGGWGFQPFLMLSTARLPLGGLVIATDISFRCMRKGAP